MSVASPRPVLTHAGIESIRRQRGRSLLLFITDRCPVGCAHCSVDSRPNSPTIRDFDLFRDLLDWLGSNPALEVVGISGGEPFAERAGLELAVRSLVGAGKSVVLFTSGIWAAESGAASWVRDVLGACACVYLSTDAYHAGGVDDARYQRAVECAAGQGTWIVAQVLDLPVMKERVVRLLEACLGTGWRRHAEVNAVPPLANGRGAAVFQRTPRHAGGDFGPCPLVTSPTIRYDGRITGCCNEDVIRGLGPARLQRQVGNGRDLGRVLGDFEGDPLLRAIGGPGLGALSHHPRLADLAAERFACNCELCWKVLDRFADRPPDRLVSAIAEMEVPA